MPTVKELRERRECKDKFGKAVKKAKKADLLAACGTESEKAPKKKATTKPKLTSTPPEMKGKKVFNPATGRLVNYDGAIGKKIRKERAVVTSVEVRKSGTPPPAPSPKVHQWRMSVRWSKAYFPLPKWKEIRFREAMEDDSIKARKKLESTVGSFMSEKFDGWRCFWNGSTFWTRGEKQFVFPQDFHDCMPQGVALDGEIFVDKGSNNSIPALKASVDAPGWKKASFRVFDYPGKNAFSDRYKNLLRLEQALSPSCRKRVRIIEQVPITSVEQLKGMLSSVLERGGEGIVITPVNSTWTKGSKIKLKGRQDDEGEIIGYNKHSDDTTKSLVLRYTPPGSSTSVEFSIGTGMTKAAKADAENVYPVGALLKFSFEQLSEQGKPLKARIVGIRYPEDL
jgi:DNA ligase-1